MATELRNGKRPAAMTEDEEVVYDFATQLHRQHQVADDVYKKTVERLGEQGIVDLIALLGYYDVVSMTINVARVQAPADAGMTLPPPAAPTASQQ